MIVIHKLKKIFLFKFLWISHDFARFFTTRTRFMKLKKIFNLICALNECEVWRKKFLFGQKNLAINKLMIISHTPSLQQKRTDLTFMYFAQQRPLYECQHSEIFKKKSGIWGCTEIFKERRFKKSWYLFTKCLVMRKLRKGETFLRFFQFYLKFCPV